MKDLIPLTSSGLEEETQQITFQVFEEYPTEVRVFCHALNANGESYLGTGHILIQIQGISRNFTQI